MAKQEDLKKIYALPKEYWIISIVILVIVLVLIGGFFYWRTGWPGYIDALKRCDGRPPVQVNTWSDLYILPGDERYRIPGQSGYRTYFCTESEVKALYYKHIEY